MRFILAALFSLALVAMASPAFATPGARSTTCNCDPKDPLCDCTAAPQPGTTVKSTTHAAPPSSAPERPVPPEPFLIMGTFLLVMFGMMFLFVFVPLGVHIWAIVDVSNTRNELFGPPWDNSKQSWLMGLAVAFFIPFGHMVAPVLWWTQVRGPRKRGEPLGRPFWMSAPPVAPPPGYYGQGQPPQPGPPRS